MEATQLPVDRSEIERFVDALFRYADDGSYANLRAFYQKRKDGATFLIEPAKINGAGLAPVVDMAVKAAQRSADAQSPVVFAPPIATFSPGWQARRVDIVNGLSLSVEVDDVDPDAARLTLEHILGRATVVVKSGSDWIDADSGEIKPKVHLHWRLSEPTRTDAEHDQLHDARRIAMRLVGADPTGAPAVHPLRWPGSWNNKATPRMARIAVLNEDAEVHLADALGKLQEAEELAGLRSIGMPPQSGPAQADPALLASAMASIPNPGTDIHYDEWIARGYACWRATGGAKCGFEMWDAWSRKSDKYDSDETEAAWGRITDACEGAKPPRTAGAGSIFYHAKLAGWVRPEREEPPPNLGEEAPPKTEQDSRFHSKKHEQSDSEFVLEWFDQIEPCLDAQDFVQGTLIEGGAAVIYGESNSGKTFFATDLALHVAAGISWNGKRVEQGCVIYCALEGGIGFRNRVSAWKGAHDALDSPVHFAAIRSSINLLDPDADVEKLIATIKSAAKRVGIPAKLAVVDTLNRAMAGGNENSSEDMGALVMNMDRIRAETGSMVLFIHHSGKDQAKGARGHSSLRAAIDTEIEVVVADDNVSRTATVVKQREMKKGDEHRFSLTVVEMGQNRHAEPVTTCLVKFSDDGHRAGALPDHRRLPQSQQRALEVLADLVAGSGRGGHAGVPAGIPSVPEEWWRDRFYERAAPGAEPEAKKKAFRRAADALIQGRLVGMANRRVWIVYGKKEDEGRYDAPAD